VRWRPRLDEQIARLEALRDRLDGCIGCGCLSLRTCALTNPDDEVAGRGPGPVLLEP
jgi:MerR family redox-sensitive transcriptional activator SoxR